MNAAAWRARLAGRAPLPPEPPKAATVVVAEAVAEKKVSQPIVVAAKPAGIAAAVAERGGGGGEEDGGPPTPPAVITVRQEGDDAEGGADGETTPPAIIHIAAVKKENENEKQPPPPPQATAAVKAATSVSRLPGDGLGLFARDKIDAGDAIGEWVGTLRPLAALTSGVGVCVPPGQKSVFIDGAYRNNIKGKGGCSSGGGTIRWPATYALPSKREYNSAIVWRPVGEQQGTMQHNTL